MIVVYKLERSCYVVLLTQGISFLPLINLLKLFEDKDAEGRALPNKIPNCSVRPEQNMHAKFEHTYYFCQTKCCSNEGVCKRHYCRKY